MFFSTKTLFPINQPTIAEKFGMVDPLIVNDSKDRRNVFSKSTLWLGMSILNHFALHDVNETNETV